MAGEGGASVLLTADVTLKSKQKITNTPRSHKVNPLPDLDIYGLNPCGNVFKVIFVSDVCV